VAGRQRSTERDRRRRTLGQNFLTDRPTISRLIAGLDVRPGELVVDLGAGNGALTLPLAGRGAEVLAVEMDPTWAGRLRDRVDRDGLSAQVHVIQCDLRRFRLPRQPYRVVASPPFGLTTELLARLLDEPDRGPARADLVLQAAVAHKHAASPPQALRTAAWAPWWRFELGPRLDRSLFRPRPRVDAALLTIHRRHDSILPPALAPGFREVLRPLWPDGPASARL